jgi:NDP-4-keto-2,6-dideoxyhexose 3-C-methyltransferase
MRIRNCRSCGSDKLVSVIDLGHQYLSDFRDDDLKPNKHPLEMIKCNACHFCQLSHSAPLSEMYTENYGFKSGVNEEIRKDLESIVDQALTYTKGTRVLDIASNDGTLLSYYPKHYYRVGVDPITKLCKEAEEHADLIVNEFFPTKEPLTGKFDIITAISCFYDVEDPNDFLSNMAKILADDGVLIIQQNYLLATLQNNAYDNICHEHIGYHSLLSMEYLFEKNGLEVVDVSTSMVNGGVLRTVVQKKGVGSKTFMVQEQRDIEKAYKLDTPAPYKKFRMDIIDTAFRLKKLIDGINAKGQKCYIYAASTRGGTIWQYVGLDVKDVPFAVDRNPGKVGKKIASIGVPIISEEQARVDKPEYMLMSIWFFKDQVLGREKDYLDNGGHFIIPLPELEVI